MRRPLAGLVVSFLTIQVVSFLTIGVGEAQVAPAISGDRMRADMAVLASDSFGGRKPGTPGGQLTTDYIAAHMKRAGLEVSLLPVELEVRSSGGGRAVGRTGGQVLDFSDDVVMVGRSNSLSLNDLPVMGGSSGNSGNG